MKHFQAVNQQDVTTINDTDCCLYLKYKIPLKTFPLYNGEIGIFSGKFVDGTFAYQHIPVFDNPEKWEYVCYFYLPVKNRDTDEVYAYALESNATMRKMRIIETRHNDSQGQITSYMHFMFFTDSIEEIQAVANQSTIYVYSNKIPTDSNYGMEIYNGNGERIFNSNKLIMRVKQIFNKHYESETLLPKQAYEVGDVPTPHIQKLGVSFTNPQMGLIADQTRVTHEINIIKGVLNISVSYIGQVGVKISGSHTTRIMLCELTGTEDFPVLERTSI
jgi:hypothetical protein